MRMGGIVACWRRGSKGKGADLIVEARILDDLIDIGIPAEPALDLLLSPSYCSAIRVETDLECQFSGRVFSVKITGIS